PRAERILELADERDVSGTSVARARELREAVAETWDKPLPMTLSRAIAAVLLDLACDAAVAKAIPILARTASLLAHLAEEQREPIGFLLVGAAEGAATYDTESRSNDVR